MPRIRPGVPHGMPGLDSLFGGPLGKVAVFIDGGYFDHVLDFHNRIRIDYERFTDEICKPDERLRTYYYHCPPWQSPIPTSEESQRLSGYQKFASRLNSLNRFEVREGRLQKVDGKFKQKGVDIQLAVDLLRLALSKNIDKAILITGDSDFVPVVTAVKEAGVTVSLHYSHELPTHHSLRLAVDERVPIALDLLKKCQRTR